MTAVEKLIEAAKAGAVVHEKYFGGALTVVEKGSAFDLATQADAEGEDIILRTLKIHFPKTTIISEESGVIQGTGTQRLLVDPLDGSFNFVLGIPQFSISIALQESGSTIAGVVYQPMLRRCYYASKGQGAYLNGKRIHILPLKDSEKSTLTYTCEYATPDERILGIERTLYKHFARVMNNWSPALDLSLLASGKTHAHFNDGNSLYDFAAGKLITREAGALITNLDGSNDSDDSNNLFLAAGSQELLDLMIDANKKN